MPGSFAALYHHFVFSTKHRVPTIDPQVRGRLYDYVGGLCRARQCRLLAAGGTEDHVHLLVAMSRDLAVSDFARDIKANSSRWIHETFPDRQGFAWQEGYAAFTVSQSVLETVRNYIERQGEHHQKRTFQEEFRELLRRHEIELDERYMWD